MGSEQQRAGAGGGRGWLCGWRRSRAKRRPRHHDQAHVSRHTCVVPPGLRPVSGASLKHKTCTVPLTCLAHRPRPARSGDIPASLVLRVSSIATASICKRRPLHLLQGRHQDTVHWARKPQASSWSCAQWPRGIPTLPRTAGFAQDGNRKLRLRSSRAPGTRARPRAWLSPSLRPLPSGLAATQHSALLQPHSQTPLGHEPHASTENHRTPASLHWTVEKSCHGDSMRHSTRHAASRRLPRPPALRAPVPLREAARPLLVRFFIIF